MAEARLRLTLTIPERSNVPTQSPAIGLTDAVHQKDSVNPFDLGEALVRQATVHPIREGVRVETEHEPQATG